MKRPLDDEDKISILSKYKNTDMTLADLAKEYKVTYQAIRSILIRRDVKIFRK